MANQKKTLLKEETIRRFMKLAKLAPLSENFLDNIKEAEGRPFINYKDDEEEDLGEAVPMPSPITDPTFKDDEEELELDLEDDLGAEEAELGADEMELDDTEGELDLGGSPMEVVADMVSAAVKDVLEKAVEEGDLEISTSEEPEEVAPMGEPEEVDLDLDMDMEAGEVDVGDEELDEAVPLPSPAKKPAYKDDDEDEDALKEKTSKFNEKVVAEIARRVAARLLKTE